MGRAVVSLSQLVTHQPRVKACHSLTQERFVMVLTDCDLLRFHSYPLQSGLSSSEEDLVNDFGNDLVCRTF